MSIDEIRASEVQFTVSDYSTEDLLRLMNEAQRSRGLVAHYIKEIAAELRAQACFEAEGV